MDYLQELRTEKTRINLEPHKGPFWNKPPINSLDYDRIIRAWPETVFNYLGPNGKYESWLSPRFSGEITPGGIYVMSWGKFGKVTGEFLEVVPNEIIKFTWEDTTSVETVVTIKLREIGLKCHLRLTHELFGGASKTEWNEGHLNEWIFFLDNLCSIAEVGNDLRPVKAREQGWEWLTGKFHTPFRRFSEESI